MYVKQLKIMDGGKVVGYFFTNNSLKRAGISPTLKLSAADVRDLVTNKPVTKLPPYNYYDAKTGNVSQKFNIMQRVAGAVDEQVIKNVEQNVGQLSNKLLKSEMPCIAVTNFFINTQTKELMFDGKIISGLKGRKIMYAMLNKLGQMQAQATMTGQNQVYIGVILNHCISKQNEYEAVFNFVVSFNALKILQQSGMNFFVDASAAEKFNYKLAGIDECKPSQAAKSNAITWIKQNNAATRETAIRLGVMMGKEA
jgi:hypothetical protein